MQILTIKELSTLIRIKEKTLYYMVSQGSIPHYRIGKLVRFKLDEIEQWMESKATSIKKSVDKKPPPDYTPDIGRPDYLNVKEVIDCCINEEKSGT